MKQPVPNNDDLEYVDFSALKDKHVDETAIFFGSGPTLNAFTIGSRSPRPYTLVGVNEVIFANNVDLLDYLFVGDGADPKFSKKKTHFDEFAPLQGKYIGRDERAKLDIPTLFAGSVSGAQHYLTKLRAPFTANLLEESVGRWGSISFDVMQILAWMGFSRIVLVGHDCDYSQGTFNTKFSFGPGTAQKLVKHWALMKDFLDEHYPHLEVLSVRPKGLTIFPEVSNNELFDLTESA